MRDREPDSCFEAALTYAGRGWPVVPIHPVDSAGFCGCGTPACRNPGKHPAGVAHGLHDATRDEEIIGGWWQNNPDANVAILVGPQSGLLAIDIDPRHGGDVALAELEREHGPLPKTVRSRTGGGGSHIIFRLPDGVSGSCEPAPGVEIYANDHLLVEPPSLHASQQRYEWGPGCAPDECEIAEPPEWVVAALATAKATPAAAGVAIAAPSGGAIAPIPNGARHKAFARLAGTPRARALSPAAIEAALIVTNRERCQLPLDADEIAEIARDIGAKPAAHDDAGEVAAEVAASERVKSALATAIIAGPAFEQRHYEPRPLVFGSAETFQVRRGSLVVRSGPMGLYKSTFGAQLARALTLGEPIFDIPTTPTAVLVISGEEDGEELQDRFRRVFRGQPFPPTLHVMPVDEIDGLEEILAEQGASFTLDSARSRDVLGALGERCCELEIGFVSFDPLAFLMEGDETNENFKPMTKALKKWARAFNLVVELTHHDRKVSAGAGKSATGPRTSAQARVRGGTALIGPAHLLLSFEEGGLPDSLRITYAKVRRGKLPLPLLLRMDNDTGLLVPEDRHTAPQEVRDDNLERVFRYVSENPGATAKAIHKAIAATDTTGSPPAARTISNYLDALEEKNRITGAPRGKGRGKGNPKLWRTADAQVIPFPQPDREGQ